MNRQEDLTKVFDRTWKANHNDVAKRGRKHEKEFMDKMFNTNRSEVKEEKRVTPEMRVQDLNKNMSGAFNFQKQNNINNIVKKWK